MAIFNYELWPTDTVECSMSTLEDDTSFASLKIRVTRKPETPVNDAVEKIQFRVPADLLLSEDAPAITPQTDNLNGWEFAAPGDATILVATPKATSPANPNPGTIGAGQALFFNLNRIPVNENEGISFIDVAEFRAGDPPDKAADLQLKIRKVLPALRIDSFEVVGDVGDTVTLSWSTTAATNVEINGVEMFETTEDDEVETTGNRSSPLRPNLDGSIVISRSRLIEKNGAVVEENETDVAVKSRVWSHGGATERDLDLDPNNPEHKTYQAALNQLKLSATTATYTLRAWRGAVVDGQAPPAVSRQLVVRIGEKVGIGTGDPQSDLSVKGGVLIYADDNQASETVGAGDLKVHGKITGTDIIDTDQIKDNAVTNAKIKSLAANKITGSITSNQIKDLAASKITGSITSSQIEGLAASKITGSITSSQIKDLDSGLIPDLSAAKITSGTLAAGRIPGTIDHATIIEASSSGHILVVSNLNDGKDADVLRLIVANKTPGDRNNFITFSAGDDTKLGEIQGRPKAGLDDATVKFTGVGRDYAEYLEVMDKNEPIEPGDVVGTFAGKITRRTLGAQGALVVSTSPIVSGNMPPEGKEDLYCEVAFLGQVPVKINGPVRAGDYIVPSGLEDGTGIAVPAEKLAPEQYGQIAGQAWESSDEEGTKLVNVATGIQPIYGQIGNLLNRIEEQQAEIEALKGQMVALLTALSSNGSRVKTT